MKLPETMKIGEVVDLLDKALTLTGAEQKELVDALIAHGPYARANIGYLSGYFPAEKAARILALFETEHPVFGKDRKDEKSAFTLGVELGQARDLKR